MKVTDSGFSERIATPSTPSRTQQTGDAAQRSTSSSTSGRGGSPDTLQLSNIASKLQQGSSIDSDRTARLSAIASAVKSNSFQVNAMQVSRAMVSEAVSGRAG